MNLREYMFKHRITQRSFAKRLGITHVYLSNITNKKYTPSVKLATRIEEVTKGEVSFVEAIKGNEPYVKN